MSAPEYMTAIEIVAPGGPEVLQAATRPVPRPGQGQVLIRVQAAGVNPHDCGQRKRGAPPAGATDIPGLEVSGRIVGIGTGAETVGVEQDALVCALVNGGGYAQYCIAEAPLVLPVPPGMSAIEAAGIPEALFTAWLNVVYLGRLRAGEWLLVHGGTGGVASMAIQVAKMLGARVIATSGSPEKRAMCSALGAEASLDYTAGKIAEAAISATGGKGVDVILDAVGARYAAENLQALAVGGRILHISTQTEDTYTLSIRSLMAKRASIIGSMLRPVPRALKAEMAAAIRERVWPEVGKTIHSRTDSTFALARADEAHRRIENPAHLGKVILEVFERTR